MTLGIVLDDPLCDSLHDHSLTGLRRSDDHGSLPLSEWAEEVYDPVGELGLTAPGASALQNQLFVRVRCTQAAKLRSSGSFLRRTVVHQRDVCEGRTLACPHGCRDNTHEFVADPQTKLLNDSRRHIDIVITGGVAVIATANESRTGS